MSFWIAATAGRPLLGIMICRSAESSEWIMILPTHNYWRARST